MRLPPPPDLALAGVLVVACQAEMWLYDGGPKGAPMVTAVATTVFPALLALRRSAPQVMMGLASFVLLTQTMLGGRMTTTLTIAITAVLVAGSAALHLPRRTAAAWAMVYVAAAWVDVAVATEDSLVSDLIFTGVLIVALPSFAGASLRSHREQNEELARLNAQLAEQAEQLADTAKLEERTRIAREMHDVIAHSVSLMVVQAGAARHLLDKDPVQSRGALSAVEEVGREALTELRRTLGMLRDDGAPSALTPQPGTEQIPELVERARASGLQVEYAVEGDPRGVLPGASLTLYRVVQEALTNVTRYAAGARTRVRLGWESAAVELSVVDDGGGAATGSLGSSGGGHGLAGIRERVAAYGGTVAAGPLSGGTGFEVRVRLPLDSTVEAGS